MAKGRARRLIRLPLALAFIAMAASVVAPAAAVPAVSAATLQCGNTLLGGSQWLGGLGVDDEYNGQDQGTGTSCGGTNSVNGITTGFEWQCVELVNRLYLTRGWTSSYWPGNGNQMYDNAPQGLAKDPQNSISYVGPGDVVSVNVAGSTTGHVFIVNTAHRITGGTVPLISQNFGSASTPIVISTANLSGGVLTITSTSGISVIGVVHAPVWTAAAVSGTGNLTQVSSIACPSATSCVATGGGSGQPLLVVGSEEQWQEVLPPNADLGGFLHSAACLSPTLCVAAGYAHGPGTFVPAIDVGSGTSWSSTEPPLPANSQAPADGDLTGVSCTATSCTAVGYYFTTSSASEAPLIETKTGAAGPWAPVEAPWPSNAGPDWSVSLGSVACPTATKCVAIGQEGNPASGFQAGLLVTGSQGSSAASWTTTVTPLPANAAANPETQLLGVACYSATACAATGAYLDTSGHTDTLVLTGSPSSPASWTPAEVTMPADASSGAVPASVACLPSIGCVAASWYTDSANHYHGVLIAGWGAKWQATEAPLPANAAAIPSAQLLSVACQPLTSCLAVGDYRDSSGNYQGLLLSWAGKSWQPTEASLPATISPPAELDRVACTSATWCVTAGAQGNSVLLETGSPS